MKRQKMGSRILIFMLAFMMIVPITSIEVLAVAVGDYENVSTGITGTLDTSDTISMPVRIMDYEADGMLFEFAESNEEKSAEDFGANRYWDVSSGSDFGYIKFGSSSAETVSFSTMSNTYANWARVNWKNNASTSYDAIWTNGHAAIVLSDFNGVASMNDIRYAVLVYRSNVVNDKIILSINNDTTGYGNDEGAGGDGHQSVYEFSQAGDTGTGTEKNWTYAIYDLKKSITDWTYTSGIYAGLPIDASGEYIDIAHVAYFSNRNQAEAFAEYALTDGSNRGDNRGFGLLRSSREENKFYNGVYGQDPDSDGDVDTGNYYAGVSDVVDTVTMLNTYGSSATVKDYSTLANEDGTPTLGYFLLGEFDLRGIANVGLLKSSLKKYEYYEIKNGIRYDYEEYYPEYKDEVVAYLAGLLEHSLTIPERTTDGWKNYRYIKGTASDAYDGTDLATALRGRVTGSGSAAETAIKLDAGKKLVGTWDEVKANITTYYDAAYFMLNSIFVPGSYNIPQDDYDYLVLSAGTDSETEDKVYVFDAGFVDSTEPKTANIAIDYNTETNSIQNTTSAGKAHFYYEVNSDGETGNTTTLHPFLPITDRNTATGQTVSPYYQDDGLINTFKNKTDQDTYKNRNFNFALVSEGEFVYHADEELFFDFEGDDDVYLFINNELVMDIGSAHSLDGVRFELNDYVNAAKAGLLGSKERNTALSLVEGVTYDIKFYYMERHGFGSNMRINTNIKLTDPSMVTTKSAWQEKVQLDYGNIVDQDKVVEYGFSITNNGQENLYNLSFTDSDIGVKLDKTNGLTVTGSRVYDVNGDSLEVADLTAVVSHPDYEDIVINFKDYSDPNAALKAFLESLTNNAVIENSGGLWINSTVLIRGIGYKLSSTQVEKGIFDNTVLTTSTNQTESKKLQGQATMRVFVPADPMYYQWAGHDLVVTEDKLVSDILTAANSEENILNGKVPNLTTQNINGMEFVTSAGNGISYEYVKKDSNNQFTINYPKAGSYVFYVKITYNNSKNSVVVPVLVNVASVQNEVYVLDYGLKAELKGDFYGDPDKVLVPGRTTEFVHEGIAVSEPSYSPNNVTFAKVADQTYDASFGTYALNDTKFSYTPTKFMEGLDTIWTAVRVKEKEYTTSDTIGSPNININEEVEMFKSVTVLPATVVYYEDDFPAFKYKGESINIIEEDVDITNLETNYNRADGDDDYIQDIDQKQEYGHDNVYQVADNVKSSAGTLTTITVNEENSGKVAYFTFKGTGFELISRTTANASASIVVTVKDSNETIVKRIPVITEFDNYYNGEGGDEKLYQVPTVRVNDLPLGTYSVEIAGVKKRDYDNVVDGVPQVIDSYLYVDGLRIYQPLGDSNENYSPEENGANFNEIRNRIAAGEVAVVEWISDFETSVSSGTSTWVENRNNFNEITGEPDSTTITENVVDSVNDYLLYGPNNEVYLEGTFAEQALMFYVNETEPAKTQDEGEEDVTTPETPKAVHNLQVAMRGIDTGLFLGAGTTGVEAKVEYATVVTEGESTQIVWQEVATLVSSTEQYYTIDYTKCPLVEGKGYQVVLKVTDPDVGLETDVKNAMVSFTTLKMNGLEIVSKDEEGKNIFGDAATFTFNNGFLVYEEDDKLETTDLDDPEELTPPDEEGEDDTTPPDDEGGDDTTPPDDEGGDDTTPPDDEGGDNATPPDDEGGDDTTPPDDEGGDDTTPPDDEGGDNATPPDDEGGDNTTPPDDEGGDNTTPPNNEGGELPPDGTGGTE